MKKELKDYEEVEHYLYDMKTVRAERITENDRWQYFCDQVVLDETTGLYYLIEWTAGATEHQDLAFHEQGWTATIVTPVEKTYTDYEIVKR